MADDGLLLNFSFGNEALSASAGVKGGTWRARRRAQLSAKPRSTEIDLERPAKRMRITPSANKSKQFRAVPSGRGPADQPKQVISSLFSFNPEPTTNERSQPDVEQDQNAEPSNAPLTAEQESLVGLGLSARLAAHLTTKMGIIAPTAIQKAALEMLIPSDADAFVQAETGSGKTLAYVLPILQRLMHMSEAGERLHRHSGLFAIIMAPTRELSKQIFQVLENLLRCAHWLVPGIVIGGEKKQSEKARLRKGVNILVATPGRLVDHLSHTEALDVSRVRWLVLDEGDRLMELGFEEDIKKIVSKLDFAQKAQVQTIEALPKKRINILCSATLQMDVQRLGEISLHDASHIQVQSTHGREEQADGEKERTFSAPAQLKQSYAIVPAKLRLVSLIALLKRTFARKGAVSKAIVFISCADSVDFHFEVLSRSVGSTIMQGKPQTATSSSTKEKKSAEPPTDPVTSAASPLVSARQNDVKIYRLHGSLPQTVRTMTIQAFSKDPNPAYLVCTDIASRGLDVSNVDFVIEYDPPCSKDEHLHRIGRTARAGKDGRASIFLTPGCEEGYIEILKSDKEDGGLGLTRHLANDLLRKGFVIKNELGLEKEGGWEERATDWQLEVERWVLETPKMLEAARRAFQSHVRAYATHVAAERGMFDIKQLHLGHLCKAFGLREKPGSINVPGMRQTAGKVKADRSRAKAGRPTVLKSVNTSAAPGAALDVAEEEDALQAKRKMRKMSKMMSTGASEFNLG